MLQALVSQTGKAQHLLRRYSVLSQREVGGGQDHGGEGIMWRKLLTGRSKQPSLGPVLGEFLQQM